MIFVEFVTLQGQINKNKVSGKNVGNAYEYKRFLMYPSMSRGKEAGRGTVGVRARKVSHATRGTN